eukprot:10235677-Alexandrium_andersonii.AAC.1
MPDPISGVLFCLSTGARRSSACAPSGSAACAGGAACRSGGRTSCWPSQRQGCRLLPPLWRGRPEAGPDGRGRGRPHQALP